MKEKRDLPGHRLEFYRLGDAGYASRRDFTKNGDELIADTAPIHVDSALIGGTFMRPRAIAQWFEED